MSIEGENKSYFISKWIQSVNRVSNDAQTPNDQFSQTEQWEKDDHGWQA